MDEQNNNILNDISKYLQQGRMKNVKELVSTAIEQGYEPDDILNNGLISGMNIVGEKFKNNEVYVPEVLIAARAMTAGTEILKPHLVATGVEPIGTVVIGTVEGDMHDIGKNLVKMMMEGKGINVIDLGVDVKPAQFIEAAKEHNAKIIACSALLTTTMGKMEDVVNSVRYSNLDVKVMIGGAPVTQAYCDIIGADAYTPDAATAAEVAASILVNK